jgi:hypothetical protein
MKDCTSLTVFGAGQFNIPLSLAGSIANFSSSTTSPRYSIFGFLNSYFLALKYRSYSHAFFNIIHLIFFEAIDGFGKCKNVVHIDNNQVLFNFLFEYLVHHSLEGCRGITHSKEHDSGFI